MNKTGQINIQKNIQKNIFMRKNENEYIQHRVTTSVPA